MRRGLAAALLLCLAGAVLLLAGGSAQWVSVVVDGVAPLPDTTVMLDGGDLAPGLRALGVVALAGVPALLAVRRAGRVLVGGLLVATGAGAMALVAAVLVDLGSRVYGSDAYRSAAGLPEGADVYGDLGAGASVAAYGALVGGALLVAAGLLTVVRGRAWPALGRRYDAPAGAARAAGARR